ncbi:MAG: hypothetical protein WD016_05435 [Balneolaceae bacterium]
MSPNKYYILMGDIFSSSDYYARNLSKELKELVATGSLSEYPQ